MENPEKNFEKPVNIRDAKPDDIRDIQNVFYKSWLDTYPNEEFGISREDIEERFKERFSEGVLSERKKNIENLSNDERYFVAEVEGKIVAVCRAKKGDENTLSALYVLPEFQGRGIGRTLWSEARNFLGDEKDIHVHTASYNQKAIDFYQSLGFRDTGRRFSFERFRMKNGNIIPHMEMVLKTAHLKT